MNVLIFKTSIIVMINFESALIGSFQTYLLGNHLQLGKFVTYVLQFVSVYANPILEKMLDRRITDISSAILSKEST